MFRTRRLLHSSLTIAAFVLGIVVPAASAADNFYLGTWKIASAVVAPWWDDPVHKPDATGMKALLGKTITITAKAILGPSTFACRDPRYEVKDYPADWLFEGSFGEMHARDKTADPAKLAAALGFRGSSWKTLKTGCASEIEYHFIDSTTAAIGLDNYVYTLKKQP
jgi:hypothetical protein